MLFRHVLLGSPRTFTISSLEAEKSVSSTRTNGSRFMEPAVCDEAGLIAPIAKTRALVGGIATVRDRLAPTEHGPDEVLTMPQAGEDHARKMQPDQRHQRPGRDAVRLLQPPHTPEIVSRVEKARHAHD